MHSQAKYLGRTLGSYEVKYFIPPWSELNMVTLEERRKRGDLVEMYKTISGKNNVRISNWFELAHSREGAASTRSTSGALNVVRNEGRNELRKNFWSVRVCDTWNSLPDCVKLQPTTNFFKNALDNITAGARG